MVTLGVLCGIVLAGIVAYVALVGWRSRNWKLPDSASPVRDDVCDGWDARD